MQVRAACQSHGVIAVASSPVPQAGAPDLHLLRRVGVVDPTSLDAYRTHGGYAALRRALDLGPEGVLREVNDSKLLRRGGAAFPTGRKWEAVAQAPVHPHYLICNADESEPGTFKDRILIAAFFRDESCGQCVPCRVGTVRQEEMLHRLCTGHTLGTIHDELALHAELGQVMRDASICGLGHTAANAIA
jgi:NADH:ubiquinone oxidoreductase subunit F (NADH-binding)